MCEHENEQISRRNKSEMCDEHKNVRTNDRIYDCVVQVKFLWSNTNTRLEEAQLPLCLVTYCFFENWVTSEV